MLRSKEMGVPQEEWQGLSKGSANRVYYNPNEKKVFKIRIYDSGELLLECTPSEAKKLMKLDEPERSVRIWNEIYPGMPAQIDKIFQDGKEMQGWTCPYIDGRPASDKEISQALIDIFNATGRIVIDAANNNFLKTNDKVFCIDVGAALKLGNEEIKSTVRRKSQASFDAWEIFKTRYHTEVFPTSAFQYPKTIKTIKSLIFITLNFPEISKVNFLTDPRFMEVLVRAYDRQAITEDKNSDEVEYCIDEDEDTDKAKQNITHAEAKTKSIEPEKQLDGIKQNCQSEIQKYIDSRGSINQQGIFKFSTLTTLFGNTSLITLKVKEATTLMDFIQNAKSLVELENIFIKVKLTSTTTNPTLFAGAWFTSGFAKCIDKCMMMIDEGRNLDHIGLKKKP